ncbi:copper amine oxidase N-terminal domain-containing protein [Paenibacillus sp. V4I5]|uniref:copper amine oxidase N-terminal domain-containing protein n=1 Tax=Paenibacillus sp. V4I5 TaxID=3042306 RepID=UPI002793C0C4|nr:copper amine oxidase N-terminal domain-containing protein [Paenibacillus sp. V4I5]MDQ0916199.1 hypothetical protein [Paenibacillus sp. V4I5]
MMNKKMLSTMLGCVLAACLTAAGIAFAFGETAPGGVEIKGFSLEDTASDIVGAADFTPEGNKDGHYKLSLKLEEETTIHAVVLRSTDDYGKDNYQGVWRTNRATTGWLLGIMQGTDIINPGFRKDVKEPVGTYKGTVNWDLYASNNGTIKETQYYVLEIETPKGTVVSKPIKFKKPQGDTSTTPNPTLTPAPSSTPASTPTPVPSTTPIPVPTASPIKVNPLKVTGGTNIVTVEGGTPESTVSLMLIQSGQTITMGQSIIKSDGTTSFYVGLPGTEYYVFNAAGKRFGPVTVTAGENSSLFNLSNTTATATFNPASGLYDVKVSGEVQDSVEKVTVSGYYETIPIVDNKFNVTYSADPYRYSTRVVMSAATADGTKTIIYMDTQRDLVDNLTVEATQLDQNGTWLIKGKYASGKSKDGLEIYWKNDGGQVTYLQDERLIGKAAPLSKEEADLKQSMNDFEYKITTKKDRIELGFYVKNSRGEFEYVTPMEGLGTMRPLENIYMQIDSTTVRVNGKEQQLEVAPYYFNGRTMVPIRFISEAMGVEVGWNSEDQTVTLTRGDTQIKLQIHQYMAYVNGVPTWLDTWPMIKDGVTMVPLRFVGESLNKDVQFDEGRIHITNKNE